MRSQAPRRPRRARRTRTDEVAAPYKPPKPSLTLEGRMARKLFTARPGARVSAQVTGRITNMGIRDYAPGKPPTVTLEIDKTTVS